MLNRSLCAPLGGNAMSIYRRHVRRNVLVVSIVLLTWMQVAFCLSTVFSAGTYIIPMDTGTAGQDNGMLRAYGLVYSLLRAGVPVYWVINPAKPPNGDDFATTATGQLQDFRTGTSVTSPRSYRGGPFLISSADAAKAAPVITYWQATGGDATAVHKLKSGTLNVNVATSLVRAPRLVVLKDGSESIAFNDLNAAGIPDGVGDAWSEASPDVLTESDVAGPTDIAHDDGGLFLPTSGLARYCHLSAMHLTADAGTPETVAEVRSWLGRDSQTHAYLQCESARSFESAAAGRFLTVYGLDDDGDAATGVSNRVPATPLTQIDGAFEVDSGTVDSMRAIDDDIGPYYWPGVATLINEAGAPLTQRIVMLSGRMDGSASNGRVTELAGHDYSVDLPITSNPQTNGVRLFLNSVFASDCAAAPGQPDGTLTVSAPATTGTSGITYSIEFSNPSTRPAENIRIFDALPAGSTFVVASDGGTEAGGLVTWALAAVEPGANVSVSLTVGVTVDTAYTNAAEIDYSDLTARRVISAPVDTTRDNEPVFRDGFEGP